MNPNLFSSRGRGAKVFLFPLLVLLTGVALTIFAAYFAARAVRFENETIFQNNVQDIENSIQTRMESYTALLRSGAGLLTTTPEISSTQFQSYIEPLRIPRKYPGLTELGVTLRVPPSERRSFVQRMRSTGFPQFQIWPDPSDEDSFPVIAAGPGRTNSSEILGFDMLSDPARQQAMAQAAQTGDAVATGKLLLKDGNGPLTHTGFIAFMPFYTPILSVSATAERSAQIRGFLYAAFRAEDFFRVLLDSPLQRGLRFQVYDDAGTNTQQLLFRSSASAPPVAKVFNDPYRSESHIIVAGHRWTIDAWLRPEFVGNWFAAPAILVFGTMMSLILAYHSLSRSQSQHQAELSTRELRRSGQALRESQEHLRLMIESASDYAIFSLDKEGLVTSWNSGAQRLFQYTDKEIIGLPGEVLFTPEDRARGEAQKELAAAAREGAAQDERWHLRKDETRFFASGMVRPIHDAAGKMRGYIKVARDFTERRIADQKIVREKEFSDTLIDSLPGIFYLFDQQGRNLRWNENFERWTGYSEREIKSMHPVDFFAGEDKPVIGKKIGEAFSTGQASVEAELLTKDGKRIPFFFTGRLITIDERPCIIGSGIDISERRKAEESLREAQQALRSYATQLEDKVAERTAKLEESLEAMAGVMYHVAHDLRAPLRAMSSFTEILLNDYLATLDSSGKDYLERIAQASKKMDELVNALLAYGRLTHVLIVLEDVDVEQIIHELIQELDEEMKNRCAKVEVRLPLPQVRANAEVLKDTFRHLLTNALLFSRRDKPVRISIWGEEGKTVRVWMEDTGIGIDPQYHERIFKMFERLNPQEEYPGTGMGLALVRKAMDRMGGRVGVESSSAAGSRFWLELPPASRQALHCKGEGTKRTGTD
jgi:PAS domain S-box-containing protein